MEGDLTTNGLENNDDINYTVQVNKSQDNHQSLHALNRFKVKANNETSVCKSINRGQTLEMKSTPMALLPASCLFPSLQSLFSLNEFWREFGVADNYRSYKRRLCGLFLHQPSPISPHTHQYLLHRSIKKRTKRCLINGSQIFDLLRHHSFRVAFWLIVFIPGNERIRRHSWKLANGHFEGYERLFVNHLNGTLWRVGKTCRFCFFNIGGILEENLSNVGKYFDLKP